MKQPLLPVHPRGQYLPRGQLLMTRRREHITRSVAASHASSEDGMARLRAELVNRGLMRVAIRGDGFCLYRAIAYGLYQDSEQYTKVFQAVMDFYGTDRGIQFFNDNDLGNLNGRDLGDLSHVVAPSAPRISIDEYKDKLRQAGQPGGVWGGEPEIIAISRQLRINIEAIVIAGWRATGEPSITYTPGQGHPQQGTRTITIAWIHGSHYDATTPCDNVVRNLARREDRKGGQSPKNFQARPQSITPLGSGKRRGLGDRDELDQVKRVRPLIFIKPSHIHILYC